ncbi:hypothetical protein D4R75_04190 [bacterium]|nr:MAG: hypothetical protein D4R75_04190 [bacterium]
MNAGKMVQASILLVASGLIWVADAAIAQGQPSIFPIPLEIQVRTGTFTADKSAFVAIHDRGSDTERSLARLLSQEFVDRYRHPINIIRKSRISRDDKFILLGTTADPLVRSYCEQQGLMTPLKELGDEGYILTVTEKNVVVAANTQKGTLFGLESLRQIMKKEGGTVVIPQLTVRDAPQYGLRGIKLYVPGRDNIPFFKRFIKDFVAYYKFNTIILELNANMRLDQHPELNIGAVEFAEHLKYSRLGRPPGRHREYQNSSHQDNADGLILEKEEVADLVSYMRSFNIEVIPELPSLTHSYYLLAGHKDLAENPNQEYPDTYCPLKPEAYKIYFDVLDEYIGVIHPSMIHIGHDEWRMEKDVCDLCRGKDYNELYAKDLNTIHQYLTKRNIKVAIWGDHLLESVYGKNFQVWKSSSGYEYKVPASLRPEQVEKLIPKDILVFNWFWNDINNDKQVSQFGFRQVYGNLRPDIGQWDQRKAIRGVLGGAPSSWAGTTEGNFGKDLLFDLLGGANLLWSKHSLSVDSLVFIFEPLISDIRTRLTGKVLPSDNGCTVRTLDISSRFNSSLSEGIEGLNSSALLSGDVRDGNKFYRLVRPSDQGNRALVVKTQKDAKPSQAVRVFEMNEDVSSIMFLHACAREAVNKKAYDMIFNFDDSADLLGWYEILYEDGFIETVPIRYGVNILDWKWKQRIAGNEKDKAKYSQNKYAYDATAVDCSGDKVKPVTFFSFEWENSRYGKKIRTITLKPAEFTKDNENAVMLLALTVSEKKKGTEAKGTEAQ